MCNHTKTNTRTVNIRVTNILHYVIKKVDIQLGLYSNVFCIYVGVIVSLTFSQLKKKGLPDSLNQPQTTTNSLVIKQPKQLLGKPQTTSNKLE